MGRQLAPDEAPGGGDPQWLCTFNDLMTLLMVFFVLLFSMSTITDPRIRNMVHALQSGLGILEGGDQTDIGLTESFRLNESESVMVEKFMEETAADSGKDNVKSIAESIVRKMKENESVTPVSTGERGEIRLESGILFQVGDADIETSGYPVLDKLAGELRPYTHYIRVEGHTDNVPISTAEFPSNWELSAQRAVNVVKYLIERGDIAPERLSAVGYGAAKPCAPNLSSEGRQRNRRVEIILVVRESHE
jgi:chemotaxis protein MotB